MRALKARTQGLVLLTATPMQVHPIEVWDLLDLLGLPPEWTAPAFLDFFEQVNEPSPSAEALDRMARLFQAVEREQAPVSRDAVERLTGLSRLKAGTVLRALPRRGEHSPPPARDARAPGGDSRTARAHADSASDLPEHAGAAAPLRRRRAARDPHRGPAGRRPFRRPERGGARPLRRRGGVHLADLPAGVRRGAVGGRLRHDDLPAPPRQQLRGPAGDVREAPRRLAVRDRRVDGGRGGGRARRRGPRRGSGTRTTSPPWPPARWPSRNGARSTVCWSASARCRRTASSGA